MFCSLHTFSLYKKFVLIVLLFVFATSCTDTVRVVYVVDGDTFITSTREKIRLSEVDAPELSQLYGLEAKQVAERLLLHKDVTIIRKTTDRYGRTIADVYTAQGEDLAEVLIVNGLAHITPWARNTKLMAEYTTAKNNNIGLFQSAYEYPYIYRRKHKLK